MHCGNLFKKNGKNEKAFIDHSRYYIITGPELLQSKYTHKFY